MLNFRSAFDRLRYQAGLLLELPCLHFRILVRQQISCLSSFTYLLLNHLSFSWNQFLLCASQLNLNYEIVSNCVNWLSRRYSANDVRTQISQRIISTPKIILRENLRHSDLILTKISRRTCLKLEGRCSHQLLSLRVYKTILRISCFVDAH